MATLREIRRRIGGVKNIQKITNAMKMVAASKLRRAQEAIVAARPYARKMGEMLRHLVSKADVSMNPLLQTRELKRVLVVVVTADRGLCGSFNNNIAKTAVEHIRSNYGKLLEEEHGVRILVVGKKGFDFFNKRKYELYGKHVGIFSKLGVEHAHAIVRQLTEGYLKAEFDRVDVIYNEFKSVIQQKIRIEQLLPVPPEELAKASPKSRSDVDYIYEPSSEEIVNALLPKHLNFQMWRILLESNAAEQGAKMAAMGNATENARELIRLLSLLYNKARQANITKELLEIVSGAEALKKAG